MGYWNLANTFANLSGNVSANTLDTNFGQIATAPVYCGVGGTANALTLSVLGIGGSPAITLPAAYSAGMSFIFEALSSNTSSNVTVNVGGLGAVAIVRDNNTALNIGDIQANGIYQIVYDGSNFHLFNPSSTVAGNWNRIINGGMVIDQRNVGTAVTTAPTGTFIVDRFKYVFNAPAAPALVSTVQQVSTVPSATALQRSTSWTCTTAHAVVAAGDYAAIIQNIEGYNATDLAGTNGFTLVFWARATKTGTYCVSFRNADAATASYVAEYTLTANTWKQIVIPMSAIPSANLGSSTTAIGVQIAWTLMSGSTYQTTANAWQVGNFYGTANQYNLGDTNANQFLLTGVQLYLGSVIPIYEARAFDQELSMCQRYYQKSYSLASTPGSVTSGSALSGISINNVNQVGFTRGLIVSMRGTPVVAWYSTTTGAINQIRDATNAVDLAVSSSNSEGQTTCGYPVLTAAPAASLRLLGHFTADAEL